MDFTAQLVKKHSPRRPPISRVWLKPQRTLLASGIGAAAILLLGACGGQSEDPVSEPILAVSQGIGGGGGSPPAEAQGDALPAGRPPLEVAAQYRLQMDELWGTLEKHPHDGGALLRMGQLMQDAGQPREAAYYYERYLQILPESQPVWLRLANTYGAASDWPRAAEASSRMLERFPTDASAMYSLGAALANQGQYDDARSWWEKVLQADDAVMTGRALRALERLSEL